MRILEACYISSKFRGSFVNSIIELSLSLEKDGNDVDFLFPIEAKNTEWCQLIEKTNKVYYIDINNLKDIKGYVSIILFLRKRNYDIIHTHYELYDLPITIACKIMRKKSKIIWHCHDATIDYQEINEEVISFNKKYYLTFKPDKIIVINEYFKEFLLNIGVASQDICLIKNGIYLKDLNERNNINKTFTFSTMGWDIHIKGVDFILKACNLLEKENFEFKLLLNGNKNTLEQLKIILNGKEFPEYIEFQFPQKNRMEFFNKTDLFIQASRFETFSYSVCEASYLGLPVICNNIDGLKWANELENVMYFSKNNYIDLYNKLKDSLQNTADFDKISIKKTIEEKYSSDIWILKIKSIYNSLTK